MNERKIIIMNVPKHDKGLLEELKKYRWKEQSKNKSNNDPSELVVFPDGLRWKHDK